MKWSLAELKAKADREDISMSELGKRGGRRRAATARRKSWMDKKPPADAWWNK